MTFKEKRQERLKRKLEKKEELKQKRANDPTWKKVLRTIVTILMLMILIPIVGITLILILVFVYFQYMESRYEVNAVRGMHYGEKMLRGEKVKVLAEDPELEYKVGELSYFGGIDDNFEKLGMKVVDLDIYREIMEEFIDVTSYGGVTSGVGIAGFDTDEDELSEEEKLQKEKEREEARQKELEETRATWYNDNSKKYIIVSDYSHNQVLSDVILCDIKYNHKDKEVTVYVVDEFHGSVGGAAGYIMAIPTEECDETYTVKYEHVYSQDEYRDLFDYSTGRREPMAAKPVIYLYPEEKTFVEVDLDFDGVLTTAYPVYKDGWEVTAYPDGTLVDKNNREYNYLFWEGKPNNSNYDFSEGFCIKGEDTIVFLEESLTKLGLSDKEQADFITYWAPKMENNNYNVISFQTEIYEQQAKLTVTGEDEVDTEIRVYMAWYETDEKIDIKEQELKAPERKGFTLVEWGGCNLSE